MEQWHLTTVSGNVNWCERFQKQFSMTKQNLLLRAVILKFLVSEPLCILKKY